MENWTVKKVEEFVEFNPRESIKLGSMAKKIAMDKLGVFTKKINGYELAPFQNSTKFKNGDVLLAKITPCLENGKTALVDILDEGEIGFGSTEFIVLRANEYSTSDFIYYLAISPIFRKKAISCMEGTSGRKRVNEKVLKEQIIVLPDLPTQQKIASVLSNLDAKIALNRQINTQLEQMAKLLYEYWFVQFDFPDAAGKPYKSSGGKMIWHEELKREIPEDWEVGKLGDLGTIIGGSTPSRDVSEYFCKNGMAWITPKDLSLNSGNKFITKGEIDVTEEGMKNASLKVMPKGTVLLSSRAPIGYMAISRCEVTTNQGFKSFITNENYTTEFLFYTIQNNLSHIQNNATGSTFKEVSSAILKEIKIVLPLKKTIIDFTQIVKPIFEKQDKIELETQELTALRDWLLPMLMNGQVRVG